MNSKELALKIRSGEVDCNIQQQFFGSLIKALIIDLRSGCKLRGVEVPHIITNTGDDTMWLEARGYDKSIEPLDVSNETTIYNIVPRCMVDVGSISMMPDQLSNPYSTGVFQIEYGDSLHTFSAEFRRMPIKIEVGLKYLIDSFGDTLDIIQYICTHLAFVRTYMFSYLGQNITTSYAIPSDFDAETLTELAGDLSDSRLRTIEISLEVESNIPIYAPRTVHQATRVVRTASNMNLNNSETITRNPTSGPGFRGITFRTNKG